MAQALLKLLTDYYDSTIFLIDDFSSMSTHSSLLSATFNKLAQTCTDEHVVNIHFLNHQSQHAGTIGETPGGYCLKTVSDVNSIVDALKTAVGATPTPSGVTLKRILTPYTTRYNKNGSLKPLMFIILTDFATNGAPKEELLKDCTQALDKAAVPAEQLELGTVSIANNVTADCLIHVIAGAITNGLVKS
jgi:hypothetical protein